MNNILLISEDYIKTNTNLTDNVDGKYVLPAIRNAQELYLSPIIGQCLYGKLLQLVADGTIAETENEPYKTLIDDYIMPYLAYQTIVNLIPEVSTKITNFGTVISNDEHLTNVATEDRALVMGQYQSYADGYLKKLQNYLKDNKDNYPELECGGCKDGAELNSAASTGLWLGGVRGKRIV